MKILFYDWALDKIGGGQKFNCKIIAHLSKKHSVDVLTLFPVEKRTLEKYYNVNLKEVNFLYLLKKPLINPTVDKLIFSGNVSKFSLNYDLFFNGDGQEVVNPKAKKNIMYCHFFEPKGYRPSRGFLDSLKLSLFALLKTIKGNYSKKYQIYCNSKYTQKWLKKLWDADSEIIYPPIEISKRTPSKKKNLILSTGRISPDKNYELVIEIFKKISLEYSNYELLICGKKHDESYLEKLKKISEGFNIKFKTDLSNKDFNETYSKSKFFIQAKGLDIDSEKYPGLLEHFGMTLVEAMSYGCIPLAPNIGGYSETIENGYSGFHFKDKENAIEILSQLIKDEKRTKKISSNARKEAKKYSLERMKKEIDEAINSN